MSRASRFHRGWLGARTRLTSRNVVALEVASHIRPVERVPQGLVCLFRSHVDNNVMGQVKKVLVNVSNMGNKEAWANVPQAIKLTDAREDPMARSELRAKFMFGVTFANSMEQRRVGMDGWMGDSTGSATVEPQLPRRNFRVISVSTISSTSGGRHERASATVLSSPLMYDIVMTNWESSLSQRACLLKSVCCSLKFSRVWCSV